MRIISTANVSLLLCSLAMLAGACSSDSSDDTLNPDAENTVEIDTDSLATDGCQNVAIVDGFAYAACGNGIEAVNLETLERNFITQPADDITGDGDFGVLFTQSGTTLQQFDLVNPLQPTPVESVQTTFSLFSGVSAANGILVVSGGSAGSDTQVFTYNSSSLTLALAGIPVVDSKTGNPDVHVASTANGATAYYSQDLGAVENWGIQIVELDTTGNITSLPEVVVLTPGLFTGDFGPPFGPANFPVESELLNNRLFIAHFAANGVQVIDMLFPDDLFLIPLGYEPANIATDGEQLFVVGVDQNDVDILNPVTGFVAGTVSAQLQQPVGIAASATHLAVADRTAGLVIITR